MTVRFACSTEIDAPVERVFTLSLSIDAHLASMDGSRETAIDGVTAGAIGLGEEVTWRARHFGKWWTMTSRITEFVPNERFVDEQVSGPFRRFRHEHRFRERDGRTVMDDEVYFQAPFGPIGLLAERAVLARYVHHLIATRNRWITAEAEQH